MSNQLTGKIFWINDDFKYNGLRYESFEHMTTKIDSVLIEDTLIEFIIPKPTDITAYHPRNSQNYTDRTFKINLLPSSENLYVGSYNDIENVEYKDRVSCELFDNEKKYILYGEWEEYGVIYSWWAIILK